jgi:dolichol-phosphate mannosyltransferase
MQYKVLKWSGSKNKYCLIIPVFNESPRLPLLLSRLKDLSIHLMIDIIVVDGRSEDDSRSIAMQSDVVQGVLMRESAGQLGTQLRCGYHFALGHKYAGVITIDGNNKDDPCAIPFFIKKLNEGYDFIQASRFIPGGIAENTPWLRYMAIRLLHAPILSLFSGFHWTDTTQGYRGYSARMLNDPDLAIFRDIFQKYELLAFLSYRAPQIGYRCIEIPTARRYPKGKIPTKINGASGNFDVFATLLMACLGRFNIRVK